MRAFSQLLDDLVYTRSRNTKLKLIGDYLKETPDPDRGYALAALTGTLDIPHVKPAAVRALVAERIDPVLFAMSRDYVGDTSETVSLLWPTPPGEPPEVDDATISISDAIERLRSAGKMEAPRVLSRMLDHLDASGRFALLKLALGELRVGINARLAKQALADAFGLEVEAVEEVWHGLKPPFTELFDWAEGRSEQPIVRDVPVFRPFMLAHPLEETRVSLHDYAAEWKWDGNRVQLVHAGGETRLYSRTGDDISESFPDVAEAFRTKGVLDGELLVRGSEQGVADVHGGQKSTVRMEAYRETVFEGTVVAVALANFDPNMSRGGGGNRFMMGNNDGTKFYKTEILLDTKGQQIFSGLTADVDIETKRWDDVLKIPSQAVLGRAVDELPESVRDKPEVDKTKTMVPVVYRSVNGKAVVTPVTIGGSDLTHTVIKSGLSETDVIITGPFKVLESVANDQQIKEDRAATRPTTKPSATQPIVAKGA